MKKKGAPRRMPPGDRLRDRTKLSRMGLNNVGTGTSAKFISRGENSQFNVINCKFKSIQKNETRLTNKQKINKNPLKNWAIGYFLQLHMNQM